LDQSRTTNGQFAQGNPGGPGRPPRATEKEYLGVLNEECSLEKWRAICRRAVADAENGDSKARGWLSTYVHPKTVDKLLGENPQRVTIREVVVERPSDYEEPDENLLRDPYERPIGFDAIS
jgi:hypothetical protein